VNELSNKVVITDYYYPNLDEEKKVFGNNFELIDCNGKCKTEEDVIKYTKNADAIITQFIPITKKIIDELDNCKIIVRYAIGLDTIDVRYATEKGIIVENIPDYCIDEVSLHTLSLMLSLLRKINYMNRYVKMGEWSYKNAIPIDRLSNLTLGVIAFGKIARAFIKKAIPLKFKDILVYDPYIANFEKLPEIKFVKLNTLLKNSNVISIHAPANNETKHLINKKTLSVMKQGTYLINTSRGALINEEDLYNAITEGKIAGAALDVLEKEGNNIKSPLIKLDNVIITPHIAWYSECSIKELQRKAAEKVMNTLNIINRK